MADLGTLTGRHFRPGINKNQFPPYTRTGPSHRITSLDHAPPDTPPNYLPSWAHYPVRLNGRECPMYAGDNQTYSTPFDNLPQPITNAYGRNHYHAHSIPILWTAGTGARSITVHCRHTITSGPLPRIRMEARSDLSLAAQTITADSTTDTDQALTISLTMPTQATLTIWLESTNPDPGFVINWGDISTT